MATYSDLFTRDDAGILPVQLADELVTGTIRESIALTLGRQVPVSSRDSRVPVLVNRPVARWTSPADTGLTQTTNAPFANKVLLAESLSTIVPVPKDVLDDSEFDIWEAIRPLLIQSMSQAVDDAVIFNVGKPTTFTASVIEHAFAAGNVVSGDVFNVATDQAALALRAAQTVSQQGYNVSHCAVAPGWQWRASVARTGALLANPLASESDPFPLLFSGLRLKTDPLTWAPPSAPRADTGGVTSGSTTVTDTSATADDVPGTPISGAAIPANTVIVTVTPGTGYVISQAATATHASETINVGWNSVDAIVGNFPSLLIGMRREVGVTFFDSGVITDDSGGVVLNLMQQDAVAIRVKMRLGSLVTAPPTNYSGPKSPFALVVNSGSEGPVG